MDKLWKRRPERLAASYNFVVDEVPHFVAALANFGEQIYNLLLVEHLALEAKA